MKITCPACAAQYTIADESVGPRGRKVKCASCAKVWRAMPPAPVVDEPVVAEEITEFDLSASATMPMSEHAASFDADTVQRAHDTTDAVGWGDVMQADGVDGALASGPVSTGLSARRTPGKVRLKGGGSGASKVLVVIQRVARIAAPSAVALGLLGLVAAVPYRDVMVRAVPDLAKLYALVGMDVNVRGITFAPVTAERSIVAGLPVLQIGGAMINDDTRERETAPLRLALVGADGAELFVWRVDPPVSAIQPGQTVPLASELTAPPETVAGVSIRFLQDGENLPTQVF